jgi:FkbM family methyltransferase
MRVGNYWSHSLLLDCIRVNGIALDFGVHDGGFARFIAPYCRGIIGFEPDPYWHDACWLPANMKLVRKALAARSGTLRFHVNENMCSSLHYAELNAKAINVDAITLQEALRAIPDGRIELIKMDIEGEEVAVLRTAPAEIFARVAQMTVEFHDFLDAKSVPAIRAVMSRMKSLGFIAIRFSWNTYGDVLFVNQRLEPITIHRRIWLLARYKYVTGLCRILKRTFARALQ